MANDQLCTPAWWHRGLKGIESGILHLSDGKLSLIVDGITWSLTEDQRIFDLPLSEIHEVTFPWYYLGTGVRLHIDRQKYRLWFGKPNKNARTVSLRLLQKAESEAGTAFLPGPRHGFDWSGMRQAVQAWKEALASRVSL